MHRCIAQAASNCLWEAFVGIVRTLLKNECCFVPNRFAIGREWTRAESNVDVQQSLREGTAATPEVETAVAAWYDRNTWPHAEVMQAGAGEDEASWFRRCFENYLAQMETFTRLLLRVMECCLGVDAGWLAERCTEHYGKLDVIHYPPIVPLADADAETAKTPPEDSVKRDSGRVPQAKVLDTRVSAHVDDSMLTILAHDHSAAGSDGLQMLVPPRPGGAWLDIPTVEGALVVQLGAMMQRWTADVWRATPHRVLCPPAGVVSDRLTLGFFFRPNCDTNLTLPQSSSIKTCKHGSENDAADRMGTKSAVAHPVETVEYDQISAAQFIALPKGERLSTTVTPDGAYIYTPLSAQRITGPAT